MKYKFSNKTIFKINNKIPIILFTLLSVCLLCTSVSATITPDYVAKTIESGEGYQVTKTVYIPALPPKVDIIFAFDLTGSMDIIIETAKIKALEIMNTLTNDYPEADFHFGVVSYMDYPHYYESCGYAANYGTPGLDYAYALNQTLTDNYLLVEQAINDLIIGSGWDGPQDYTRIFYESYADPAIFWRLDAKRLLVNFADNVPHDCNINQNVNTTIVSTGVDPGRDEIAENADDLILLDVLNEMDANGIALIECHTSDDYIDNWNYWTGITGGGFFITEAGTLVDDVINAIVTGLTTPPIHNLHLEIITPGFAHWLLDVIPPYYETVQRDSMVTFEEYICVPPDVMPGIYSFTVEALDVDGFSYGRQINQITVPGDYTTVAGVPVITPMGILVLMSFIVLIAVAQLKKRHN